MLLLFESLLGISWSVWILIAFVFSLFLFAAIVFIHRRNNIRRFVQLEHKIYEHADTVHKQLEYKVFRLQKLIEDLPANLRLPPTIASEEDVVQSHSIASAGKIEEATAEWIREEFGSIKKQLIQFRSDVYASGQHQETFKKGIHQLFSELTDRLYTNEKNLNRFINMLDELAQEHGLELLEMEETAEDRISAGKPEYPDIIPVFPLAETAVEFTEKESVPEHEPESEADEAPENNELTEDAAPELITPETAPEPENVLNNETIEEHSEPQSEIMDNAITDSAQTEEPAPTEDEPTEVATESAEPQASIETASIAENESDNFIVDSEEEISETVYETAEPADAPESISAVGIETGNLPVPQQEEITEIAIVAEALTNEGLTVNPEKTAAYTDEITYTSSIEEGVFYFEKPEAGGYFKPETAGSMRNNKSLYKIIVDPVSDDMASCVLLTDNAACTARAIENPEELLRPMCDIQSLKGSGNRLTLLQKGVLHKQEQGWQIRPDNRLKVLLF
jgi:hypothetical protein